MRDRQGLFRIFPRRCLAEGTPEGPTNNKKIKVELPDPSPVAIPKRGPDYYLLTPLIWAPLFPTVRLALKDNPDLQRKATIGLIIAANVHAIRIFATYGYGQ
uniref:Uncharacterized protein n=1 Tax=Lotharella globosa TaxID=91324 RepID=A0A7S3ZDH3_9EUKA|eukprot:CAMPEP_0167774768 /NCGR_PEP_ID=MMETSP0111_2-20121227/2183_1 /TAXON_ID=91324 /ORGANISM="Lotharella globosa, Strain CCCM811" /LENGTH=101 /DNA_ID=CAMNT_0007664601 /DNA_START=41 /DNA_END=346 /DNA_ORIENTATION=+